MKLEQRAGEMQGAIRIVAGCMAARSRSVVGRSEVNAPGKALDEVHTGCPRSRRDTTTACVCMLRNRSSGAAVPRARRHVRHRDTGWHLRAGGDCHSLCVCTPA